MILCLVIVIVRVYLPYSFSHRSGRLLAPEHVAGESLQRRVFGNEAQVTVVTRVERAERNVLQRVKIVDARSVATSLYRTKKIDSV